MELRPQLNVNRINLGESSPLSTPLVVYMETTRYCNLACKFCPHFLSPNSFEKGTMNFDSFKKVITDFSGFPEKVKLLRFCGLGDSLFNKEINRYIKFSSESGNFERIEMITNGLLLKDSHFEYIGNYLDRIIFSVEGLSDESYFEVTNRKVNISAFRQKLSSLKKYLSESNSKCKVHIKIHNSAIGCDDDHNKFFELFGEYADEIYVENLINLWPELESNMGINSGHRFHAGDVVNRKVCAQIFKSIQINYDAKVMPCCIDWEVKNVIGDALQSSITSIWNGSLLRDLRIKHLNGLRNTFSPCSGCNMNEESDIDNIDQYSDLILRKLGA